MGKHLDLAADLAITFCGRFLCSLDMFGFVRSAVQLRWCLHFFTFLNTLIPFACV